MVKCLKKGMVLEMNNFLLLADDHEHPHALILLLSLKEKIVSILGAFYQFIVLKYFLVKLKLGLSLFGYCLQYSYPQSLLCHKFSLY